MQVSGCRGLKIEVLYQTLGIYWVAVKELQLSYHIGETLLFTIYTHYGNPKPYIPILVT